MKLPKIKIDQQVNDFIARNIFLGLLLIVLAIIYLNNGFACERQMRQLSVSRESLRDAEYRYYVVQKRFNSIGVRSSVKRRLVEAHSPLTDSKKPNIKISE